MTQIALFQDLISDLDLYLPWLLPVLEATERTFPATLRLLICTLLMLWLTVLRLRNLTGTAGKAPPVEL